MPSNDPRVDAYISKAPEFARPILTELRAVVHRACPEVEETLKWGMPTFMHHGILCNMAAFKQHATFGFWKRTLVLDGKGKPAEQAMGHFGRLTSANDLPPRRVLAGYVKKAMQLNERDVKVVRTARAARPAPRAPADLAAALRRNARAQATYEGFSPGMKREYVEWITEAKTAPTRKRRVETAVEWMADGKQRNWKYLKK
ncbi:MAG: YdeI/OmpD-associated family protein [Gemmatimonadales bacterium]